VPLCRILVRLLHTPPLMKQIEHLDDEFTRLATDDLQRLARIAELTRDRKKALWSVLCASITAGCVLWLGTGAFWFGCAAVSCILFWCQFYQLHSELRALKTVDAWRNRALGNAT
jgi:hypothetical protein